MKEYKNRSEVEEEYKWDLSEFFESNEAFFKASEEVDSKIDIFNDYRGCTKDGNKLYEYLIKLKEVETIIEKMDAYAWLKNDEELGKKENLEMLSKSKDAIAKMVYVNGQPITNVSASDEQVEAPKEVKSEAGASVQAQTQSTEYVSSEDVSSQPQTAAEVESPETSGKVVVSQKKELPPETGNRYMEKFDNGRLKTVIRNEDGSKTTTMQDEGGEPVEIKYNADGNIVTYAKNGESFKQTAARLGFTPGTPEYEAFVNANSSASKKGWFLIISKEMKQYQYFHTPYSI